MTELDPLAKRFRDSRAHLQGVAFRMLGTLSEAEDAVQEAWLRVNRADASGTERRQRRRATRASPTNSPAPSWSRSARYKAALARRGPRWSMVPWASSWRRAAGC